MEASLRGGLYAVNSIKFEIYIIHSANPVLELTFLCRIFAN
jgi:hypothetical protein